MAIEQLWARKGRAQLASSPWLWAACLSLVTTKVGEVRQEMEEGLELFGVQPPLGSSEGQNMSPGHHV